MKNCTCCTYARWDTTKGGKLHPSGEGHCAYKVKMPKLPASMQWNVVGVTPEPLGGLISRRVELPRDCAFFAWKKA